SAEAAMPCVRIGIPNTAVLVMRVAQGYGLVNQLSLRLDIPALAQFERVAHLQGSSSAPAIRSDFLALDRPRASGIVSRDLRHGVDVGACLAHVRPIGAKGIAIHGDLAGGPAQYRVHAGRCAG